MVTLLVDDTRLFKDGRPAVVARTSDEAVAALRTIGSEPIDELWLDYDLLFDTTSQPFVDHLLALAAVGQPPTIGTLWVHTSQIRDGRRLVDDLGRAGYPARRSYAAAMWVRNTAQRDLAPARGCALIVGHLQDGCVNYGTPKGEVAACVPGVRCCVTAAGGRVWDLRRRSGSDPSPSPHRLTAPYPWYDPLHIPE